MKIDVFYDPVKPNTIVKIDDKAVDSADVFGFLYPVKQYILQTWLSETGSWNGIKQQLRELGRGEKLNLIFHGREADYSDMKNVLGAESDIELCFSKWDVVKKYDAMIENAGRLIDNIINTSIIMERGDVNILKTASDLFPDTVSKISDIKNQDIGYKWIIEIKTEEEFLNVCCTHGDCCVVDETFLYSFERLLRLSKLTASLRRAVDMIVCRFSTEDKMREFSLYASQYMTDNYRFVDNNDSSWVHELEVKYKFPFEQRIKIRRLQHIAQLLTGCINEIDTLDSRIEELKNQAYVSAKLIREQKNCEYKRRWIVHETSNIKALSNMFEPGLTFIEG